LKLLEAFIAQKIESYLNQNSGVEFRPSTEGTVDTLKLAGAYDP
jgi:hypothetical protein